MLSWSLQVDRQTEENDMNKRRRKGLNNLDEVCTHSVSLNKGPLPDGQWPQVHWTGTEALAFFLSSYEPLGSKLGLMETHEVLVLPPLTSYVTLGKILPGCGSCLLNTDDAFEM